MGQKYSQNPKDWKETPKGLSIYKERYKGLNVSGTARWKGGGVQRLAKAC